MQDEQEWSDVRLWDVGEGVCCAAFQLGACAHTETADLAYEFESERLAYEAEQERASQIGF